MAPNEPTAWDQLAASVPVRLMEPCHSTGHANERNTDAGDFLAFNKSLNGCAEEDITVSVQKEGEKHSSARGKAIRA
jgi:hypothetical protein